MRKKIKGSLDRVNRIIAGKEYQYYLSRNKALEENRCFCHHDFEHLLTVARLTYLLLLERGERFISKEMAYAAGILHDIGRFREYRDGTCHARESANLAGPILEAAGFTAAEQEMIIAAIAAHRHKPETEAGSPLATALWEADRFSRLCYCCHAQPDCRSAGRRPTVNGLRY